MIPISKILLGPVLLAQARRMRLTALRLPEAAGERSGLIVVEGAQIELGLLFVGDSTMAGVGVRNQAAAMAMQAATILANRRCCSVRWQIVAKSGVNTEQFLEFVTGQELVPADVLIMAIGTNDVTSQTPPARFIADYKALVDVLLRRVRAHSVVISGLPPLHLTPVAPQPLRWYMGRYARLLDKHLRQWIAPQNFAYVSLQWASDIGELADDGYHPGERQYSVWADLVATQIGDLLSMQQVLPASQSRFRTNRCVGVGWVEE
jgi:lysophospholipase L1-like esterase